MTYESNNFTVTPSHNSWWCYCSWCWYDYRVVRARCNS